MFGKKAFYTLKRFLNDPAVISPFWAAQFLSAYEKIGSDVSSDRVYETVTESKEFKEAADKRQVFIKTLNQLLMEAQKNG